MFYTTLIEYLYYNFKHSDYYQVVHQTPENLVKRFPGITLEDLSTGVFICVKRFHLPIYFRIKPFDDRFGVITFYFDEISRHLSDILKFGTPGGSSTVYYNSLALNYSKALSLFQLRKFKRNMCSYCLLKGYCNKESCNIFVPKLNYREELIKEPCNPLKILFRFIASLNVIWFEILSHLELI